MKLYKTISSVGGILLYYTHHTTDALARKAGEEYLADVSHLNAIPSPLHPNGRVVLGPNDRVTYEVKEVSVPHMLAKFLRLYREAVEATGFTIYSDEVAPLEDVASSIEEDVESLVRNIPESMLVL